MATMVADREVLFTPLTVRSVTLRNRFAMSPMTRCFCPAGVPGEDVARYYERRARGGVGLIVTEAVGVDHPAAIGDAGLGEGNVPVLAGAAPLAGWRRVVDAVHAGGAKIVPQLWHQGVMRKPNTGPFPDAPTLAPSGLWGPLGRTTSVNPDSIPADPRIGAAMSQADVEAVLDGYARAARNAAEAGFDGIAIHGGHGYLIDTFLWGETNLRDDQWGGSRGMRSAFPAAIVRRVRQEIGDALPIFFRFSQWKQQDFRATLADTPDELAEVLQPLADAGVDVFDASVRYFNRAAFEGHPENLAGWAKRVTGKLSMAVGGIGISHGMYDRAPASAASAQDWLPALSERFQRGEFDLIAVGRALIGDPDWVRKFRDGEPPEPYRSENDSVLT